MFTIDDSENKLNANIRVVGVGGGGSNAVETMIKSGIEGVEFIVVNTDAQALEASSVQTKIQLGAQLTKGLGAGANPDIGRRAAIESYEDIVSALSGADMVFVTAGMGGGTGTGGVSIIAEAAKELGALTVGVVTTPFLFEGKRRKKHADKGLEELKNHVDTLIVIPNEKLLAISDEDTPLSQTFQKTDDILVQAVRGIAELISVKGLINLDFADVKTVMNNKGMALMGIGAAKGPDRAHQAVAQAISSPLLEDISIQGATGIIVNVTGGDTLSLKEVHAISSLLTGVVDSDADIIVGAVIDPSLEDRLSVTVIATGFDPEQTQNPKISLLENIKNQSPAMELKQSDIQIKPEEHAPSIQNPETPPSPEEEESSSDIDEESVSKILSEKAKKYAETKNTGSESIIGEKNLDWLEESSSEEEKENPFEVSLNFNDEDLY